jgi:LPXTG-motif cell wall-anchored protein
LFGTVALLVAVAVSALSATTAGALTYTPPAIETKPCAAPSEAMTLNGSGFVPGAVAEISLGGNVLGTVVVSPSGTFSFGLTAPNATGTYQLTASDGTNNLSTTFRVATNCSGGGGGGGGLPYTGTSSTPWLVRVGVGLLAVGAAFVALVRARRRDADRIHVDA